MIVDLKTISQVPRHFDLSFEPQWWRSQQQGDDQIRGFHGSLRAHIEIHRAGSGYQVNGNLAGILELRCDRCLESYLHQMNLNFSYPLVPLPDSAEYELELLEEEMSADFITGEELHLDEIVKEQIYLSLPIKCLCDEFCAGLCPTCGTNLNTGKCTCQRKEGHPGFSKLRNLKIQGE